MTPWFLRNYLTGVPTVLASSATEAPTAVSRAFNDEPGLVWRSSDVGACFLEIDMGWPATINAFALLWTNLRATDTVRWRGAASQAQLTTAPGYDSGLLPSFAGTLYTAKRTKHVLALEAAQSFRFWRIDIAASGLPYVEIGRFLLGTRVHLSDDMDVDAVQFVQDPSVIDEGPGYEDVEAYASLIGWRCSFSWIPDAVWRASWFPFLQEIGQRLPVLFVPQPEAPEHFQDMVVYGRLRSTQGRHPLYDGWVQDIEIVSLAQ